MLFIFPQNFHEPDPPEAFRYLSNGQSFSIRPEARNGRKYWFMRKMISGKTAVVYLGPVGTLSQELVNNAVVQISAELEGGGE